MDEFSRNGTGKLPDGFRAAVSSRAEIAHFVLDLHHQDSLLLPVLLAEMTHERRKGAAVQTECLGPEGRENFKRRAVRCLRTRKALDVGLDPVRCVFRERVFPAPEPQQYQMKILLAGDIDPVIQNTEVKVSLGRLGLFPRHRHQDGIQVHPRHVGQDEISLRRCSRRRVSEFTSKNEKGLAVNHKLLSAVLCLKVRQIGRECRAKLTEDETP